MNQQQEKVSISQLRVIQGLKTEAEAIAEFKVASQTTLTALEEMGWTMHEDPEVQMLQVTLMEMAGEELTTLVKIARQTTAAQDDWVTEQAAWERTLSPAVRSQARQEFLAACVRRMVTPEFLVDAKLRWQNAEFTAVTDKYLVIGDVFVERRDMFLPLKEESDVSSTSASLGRVNVTYENWKTKDMQHSVTAVRPKINGERFVRVKDMDHHYLRGFKDLEIKPDFVPELVEYYAGQYYVLSPMLTKPYETEIFERGVKRVQKFLPHPYMTPKEYYDLKSAYCNHKYDGIMLWTGEEEFRAKWEPTVEVTSKGCVWEVYLATTLQPIRPRPGKVPVMPSTATARIRSCFRAQFVIPFLVHMTSIELPEEILAAQQYHAQEKPKEESSKVFFITAERKIVGLRLPNSRLDLVGGQLKNGESPMDAAIREVYEETQTVMKSSQLCYLGPSREQTDGGFWISHIFFLQWHLDQLWTHNMRRLMRFQKLKILEKGRTEGRGKCGFQITCFLSKPFLRAGEKHGP